MFDECSSDARGKGDSLCASKDLCAINIPFVSTFPPKKGPGASQPTPAPFNAQVRRRALAVAVGAFFLPIAAAQSCGVPHVGPMQDAWLSGLGLGWFGWLVWLVCLFCYSAILSLILLGCCFC